VNTKTCSKCKETLSTELFSKRTDSKDGLRGECKSCIKLYQAQWQNDNAGG